MTKPDVKPDPNFGSGPCKKRPGYTLDALKDTPLGRSHRSELGLSKIKKALQDTHRILKLPADYLVGIVPASDTGAVEMAMWSMLGPRPVAVCYWEAFGLGWYDDAIKQLKLKDVVNVRADYGRLPDFSVVTPQHDVVFTWNGTTSGVKVPNADWISDDREGIVICDATSAIFAQDIPWNKVDVVTYSWQKVLGGEGGHGVMIISPRAIKRLESYVPPWPMPKIYRLTKGGKLNREIFEGQVINTPSMMCIEDYLDALKWVDSIGGLAELLARSARNFAVLEKFVAENSWIHFLADNPVYRSNTSVCLTLDLPADKVKTLQKLLSTEKVAYDIGSYRDAPPGLRIWCGSTVETHDLEILTQWITWAYNQVK
mmetsp:Transcript_32870/g.53340  ORF Transcript_32870/g.53340 Transcript_32870/m.53340 type:complete len:371 (-) Transcript_32870:456-1568(-)